MAVASANLPARHAAVTAIAFIFFGVHIAILGYLIVKSGFVPRILGSLLILASTGYFIDSFASFLSSDYVANEIAFWLIVVIPAVIAEFSLTLWLLLKGGKVQQITIVT